MYTGKFIVRGEGGYDSVVVVDECGNKIYLGVDEYKDKVRQGRAKPPFAELAYGDDPQKNLN